MSKKDSKFKYVSGDTLSTSDTSGHTFRPRTLLSVSNFDQSNDVNGRRSHDKRQSPRAMQTALRLKATRDESPDSWPKRNPIKRSGSCAPAVGGRLNIKESTSDSRLDCPQRQDSMELCWSEDTFRVEDLVRSFSKSFPIIVKVVHGYSGGDGSDLDLVADQVLQLHSHGTQHRVILSKSDGPEISLPLTYPLSCKCLLSSRPSGPSQSLERAIVGAELPQNIQVTGHAQHADESTAPVTAGLLGSVMTVTSLYYSNYVTAHIIKEGWLNTTRMLTIPQEMNAVFRIALGIKGAEPEVWADYSGMFSRTARDARSQLISGYPSIIYSSWSSKCHCCRLSGDLSPDGEQFVDESDDITISSLTPLVTSHKTSTVTTSPSGIIPQYATSSKLAGSSKEVRTSTNHHGNMALQLSSCGNKAGTESSTKLSNDSRKIIETKYQLKRRNSSYLPSTPLSVFKPTVDTEIDYSAAVNATSCHDLSSVIPSDQFSCSSTRLDSIGDRTPTKRSVPYMGTRDITHKFTYCNFKVSSTPKSNLAGNSGPNSRGNKQLTVRFSPSDSKDSEDRCVVEFNGECDNQGYTVKQEADESDFMNSLSLNDSLSTSAEQSYHLANGCDSTLDTNATLASVCDSIDDGYDTKESTMSSAGSVTYRKQFSPVYF